MEFQWFRSKAAKDNRGDMKHESGDGGGGPGVEGYNLTKRGYVNRALLSYPLLCQVHQPLTIGLLDDVWDWVAQGGCEEERVERKGTGQQMINVILKERDVIGP